MKTNFMVIFVCICMFCHQFGIFFPILSNRSMHRSLFSKVLEYIPHHPLTMRVMCVKQIIRLNTSELLMMIVSSLYQTLFLQQKIKKTSLNIMILELFLSQLTSYQVYQTNKFLYQSSMIFRMIPPLLLTMRAIADPVFCLSQTKNNLNLRFKICLVCTPHLECTFKS